MAKTTKKAGKRATAAGRSGLRARKSGVDKTRIAKLRKLKPARPGPRKGKHSLPPESASLKRQLKAARMQQQASAEILRAVANASGDVARPLQQIAETTARLFGAPSVSIQLAEGGEFTQEYRVGGIAQRIGSAYPRSNIRVGGRNLPGTVVFENRQIHIPDLDHLDPSMSDFPGLPHARAGGARTVCGTPLRREGKAIGVLIIFLNRLLPFTEDELALQQSFADQAVIAIENARLFNEVETKSRELGEALQQQIATAEVLQVTSNSPGELGPVFRAVLENATRICNARFGTLLRFDDNAFYFAADVGTPAALAEYVRRPGPFQGLSGGMIDRILKTRQVQHTPDYAADAAPGLAAKLGGARSTLGVPILRDDILVGAIVIYRQEVRPFSNREIDLVRSFAAQAAIAIENARLFNETKEALERQTAASDVLQAISESMADTAPVFESILDSCETLLQFTSAAIVLIDGNQQLLQTVRGPGTRILESLFPQPLDSTIEEAFRNRQPLYTANFAESTMTTGALRLAAQKVGGYSLLQVPMFWQGRGIGAIYVSRLPNVAFSDKEVALLATFADQAVIAIQNARLFNETKRALERQTATADVLRIISRSVAHAAPVFDTILESCQRLFNPYDAAVYLVEGDRVRGVARRGPGVGDWGADSMPLEGSSTGVAIAQRQPVHFPDLADKADLPEDKRAVVKETGGITVLYAPMISQDSGVGSLVVTRRPKKPFTETEIDFIQSFADQAVIAIENTRLFNETREALERQTATSDILKVIASSPSDVQPVFDAIVASANRLMAGFSSAVFRFTGGMAHLAAFTPTNPAADDALRSTFPRPIDTLPQYERALRCEVTHFADAQSPDKPDMIRRLAQARGFGSMIVVPLIHKSDAIGILNVARREASAFPENQVQLLQTFADQAVIAIENARLFDEVQAKTSDLEESLQQQIATADVLKVISRSAFDLNSVMNTLTRSAAELCKAELSALYLRDGDLMIARGMAGVDGTRMDFLRDTPLRIDNSGAGRALQAGSILNMADVQRDGTETTKKFAEALGFNSILFVPLMREGRGIGVFALGRKRTGEYSQREVDLLQTFADQAVIAIENTRLFNETQEALEVQKASADILNVISHSVADPQPVFDKILRSIEHLFGAEERFVLLAGEDGLLHIGAVHGPNAERAHALFPVPLQGSASEVAIRERRLVTHANVFDDIDVPPVLRETARRFGKNYSMAVAPMLWEDRAIGSIFVGRTSMEPFSEKECSMLRTFADQAVIAIQNARMFNETREALERQTATADILNVIASSPSDTQPVFDAIAESSNRLLGGRTTTVLRFIDDRVHLVAFTRTNPAADAMLQGHFPMSTHESQQFALAKKGTPTQVFDTEESSSLGLREIARARGYRSQLYVPLMDNGLPVGIIVMTRADPGAFADHHVELLQTFADQALIAISNVELFKQVQQRTHELSKSLDDLRTAQDRLVQTEKLASLGQLTAGIAHEIKNPLNFVNNFSALSAELVDEMTDVFENPALDEASRRKELDEIRELLKGNLEKVVQHGKRADSIVKNMLLHSREGSGERRASDLNALVSESLNLAYHGARAERSDFNITLERDLDPDAGAVEVYPQELTRALLNLISNGFYAAVRRKMDGGGATFEPVLSATTKNAGEAVEIRIRDNGPGIPPDIREKIFNPFFTTKPTGEGTGLGLSMTHDIIVKQHGGRIDVETELGAFTEFTITLPRGSGTTDASSTE
jgi:GAF domain-containing protein